MSAPADEPARPSASVPPLHIPAAVAALRADHTSHVGSGALTPPPRFSDTTFDTYRIDPAIAGQAQAVATIQAFAQAGRRRFWQFARRSERQGLYLDGDFGVGKTHLLAACYHAVDNSRSYLSFSEAISLTVLAGPEQAVQRIAADLVCIDEFELDDPSNTRLADLLLAGLIDRGCRVVTTSNTVPGELGAGRFAAERFHNQLVRIAGLFTDVHVPGVDFRRQDRGDEHDWLAAWGPHVEPFPVDERTLVIDAVSLDELLQDVPVINLRLLAQSVDRVAITALGPCPDQLVALRFVHLVDKLYDHRVALRVTTDTPIAELFLPEYRDWAFKKKYRRCQSRLTEMCGGL